ncbi:MAG: hypothetical protein REI11_14375, partial [Patulibacter sp.]|nr:hypothetical protein [Patulibacter sp.]
WRSGDELAAAVAARCGTMVVALHDRQAPGGRNAIDHLLVAPTGVWVVGTDRHHGRVDVSHPPLTRPRLTIAGHDRTDLVDALEEQLDAVGAAMVRIDPRVAVRGALCMITPKGLLQDAGLPTLRPLEIRGYPVASPKRVTRLLVADDAIVRLPAMERTRTARALAQRFPAQRGR